MGAGGGVLLHEKHIRFLRRFGLKKVIYFAHFGLESGMVFEGTTGVYERICLWGRTFSDFWG